MAGNPLYAFGFGKGYSTFRYSSLQVSHSELAAGQEDLEAMIEVQVAVSNQGEYTAGASEEVVMVYATPDRTGEDAPQGLAVPRQMLLGFTKVAVPPNGSVQARISVPGRRLRLVGKGGELGLIPGRFTLHVGGRVPGAASASPAHAAPGGTEEPLTAPLRVVRPVR